MSAGVLFRKSLKEIDSSLKKKECCSQSPQLFEK